MINYTPLKFFLVSFLFFLRFMLLGFFWMCPIHSPFSSAPLELACCLLMRRHDASLFTSSRPSDGSACLQFLIRTPDGRRSSAECRGERSLGGKAREVPVDGSTKLGFPSLLLLLLQCF